VQTSNREALGGMAPLRAVLPGGAGVLKPKDFAAAVKSAFDPEWLAGLVG
jgi:dethiobiotin synthetase